MQNLNFDPSNNARAPHTVTNEVGAVPEPKNKAPLQNDWTQKQSRWNGPDCTSKRPTK